MPRFADEQHQLGAQRPNSFAAKAIGVMYQQQVAAGAHHAGVTQSDAGPSLSLMNRRFDGAGLSAAPIHPGIGVLKICAADETEAKRGITETQSFGAHYVGDAL